MIYFWHIREAIGQIPTKMLGTLNVSSSDNLYAAPLCHQNL
ncbi:hypothetical protein [uncultured Helicobacter sp.]|nr:hypothetical protein [uncultured Helicobacter sp.]